MDLWPEMKLLEQTNLTRGGAWLELVRTKQERLGNAKPKKDAKSSDRSLSKRQQFRLEKKAKKERNRLRTECRRQRKLLAKIALNPLSA